MQSTLDAASLKSRFERDGFVSPLRIHRSDEADAIRRDFDALEREVGREKSMIGLVDAHFTHPFVWRLATDPRILDAVEAVLGPDLLLLATHFFCKHPAAPSAGSTAPEGERFVAWHQDVTYWGLEPPFAVTAWYAVDDSDAENGCMRVIPGTHDAVREHAKANRAGNLLSINQEVPVSPEEEASAVDLTLRAGEISLHHGRLIHGSNPNRSNRRRCGLTLRYIPPSVRQAALNSLKGTWTPSRVRGEDPYGHFRDHRPEFAR